MSSCSTTLIFYVRDFRLDSACIECLGGEDHTENSKLKSSHFSLIVHNPCHETPNQRSASSYPCNRAISITPYCASYYWVGKIFDRTYSAHIPRLYGGRLGKSQ